MTSSTDGSKGLSSGNVRRDRIAIFLALTLAASAESWTTSGMSLTLTDLTGNLSASSDEASWALTVYTTAYAVSVASSLRLSTMMGNRNFLILCSLLYAVASLGCALSGNLGVFLFFRALAGFAGGAFLIRSLVFVKHQFDLNAMKKAVVTFGVCYFTLGRILSPLASGWLADNLSWRYLFAVSTILPLISAIVFASRSDFPWFAEPDPGPFDLLGFLLLVSGAICMQTALSRGEVDGWFESMRLVMLLICGIAGNALFAIWQLSEHNRTPLFRFEFVRERSEFAAVTIGFVVGVLLAGSLYALPQYLRGVETHSAFQTGALLSIGGLASVILLSSFQLILGLIVKLGGARVLAIGLTVECVSQLLFAHYVTSDTPDTYLWVPLFLNGLFIALTIPTLGIVVFTPVSGADIASARTLYYGFRQLGASVGITCASVLIDRRLSFHSSRLLDAVANRNSGVLGVSQTVLSAQNIYAASRRQSFVLSYADVFVVMASISIFAFALLPLLPEAKLGAPAPSAKPNETDVQKQGSPATEGAA